MIHSSTSESMYVKYYYIPRSKSPVHAAEPLSVLLNSLTNSYNQTAVIIL